jgi:hypothetical protein
MVVKEAEDDDLGDEDDNDTKINHQDHHLLLPSLPYLDICNISKRGWIYSLLVLFDVLNATFNNISVISWRNMQSTIPSISTNEQSLSP